MDNIKSYYQYLWRAQEKEREDFIKKISQEKNISINAYINLLVDNAINKYEDNE
jgi:hypothetical protein